MEDWQLVLLGMFIMLVIAVIISISVYYGYFDKERFKQCRECEITDSCPLGKVRWYIFENSIPQLAPNKFQEHPIDSTTATPEAARAWVLNSLGISSSSNEQCAAAFLVYPHQNESGTYSGNFYYGRYPSVSEPSIMSASTDPTKLPWYQWDTHVFSTIQDILPLSSQPT